MSTALRSVVHVFATFGAGGPQIRALQLMAALGPACRHIVLAMDGRTEAAAQRPVGVDWELAPPPERRGFVASVQNQRRWLRSVRPDLVLTYNWGAIESVIAARSLGLPLVHHEDGFLPDEAERRLARRSWLRRLVLRGVPVVVPSHVLLDIATREWGLAAHRVHCLPNGVDLVRFAKGSPVTAPVIGTVGGLRPEKDHATLLQALAALPADVHAEIVGGGALLASLQQEAEALGVAARVAFRGAVADTAPCYRRLQVFVLSSRTEQMPIALLEAMASGLPVVATDVGDVRTILPAVQQPFVVPRQDPRALAAALARVLADGDLRQQLGAANRAHAESRYPAGPCLQRFLDVYRGARARA